MSEDIPWSWKCPHCPFESGMLSEAMAHLKLPGICAGQESRPILETPYTETELRVAQYLAEEK